MPISSPHTLTPRAATANPLAVLIVDGGERIGFGHVGRCCALWEELEGRAVFVVADALLARMLRGLGAEVATPSTGATTPGAEVATPGAGATTPGAETATPGAGATTPSTQTPVAVIDRRTETGAAEVARMQARGQRVCLLDDPGPGRGMADLLVDPPTGVSWPPAGGRRLAGFAHVLLRRDIRTAAATPRGADIDVLLSLGGSDPEGLTPTLARALAHAGLQPVSVLGPGYRGPRPAGRVLENPSEWPGALAGACLLVGRFGHTLLEAAHLGTPALALAVNARAMTEATAFAAHGTSEAIRVAGERDIERVAACAAALLADSARCAAMARRGRELVDGLGAPRVALALRELAGEEVGHDG